MDIRKDNFGVKERRMKTQRPREHFVLPTEEADEIRGLAAQMGMGICDLHVKVVRAGLVIMKKLAQQMDAGLSQVETFDISARPVQPKSKGGP